MSLGQSTSGCPSERKLRVPLVITGSPAGGRRSSWRRRIGEGRAAEGCSQRRRRFGAESGAEKSGERAGSSTVLSEQLSWLGVKPAASASLSTAGGSVLPSARRCSRRSTKRDTSACPVLSGRAFSVLAAASRWHLKGIEFGGGEHLTSIARAVKSIGLRLSQPVTSTHTGTKSCEGNPQNLPCEQS